MSTVPPDMPPVAGAPPPPPASGGAQTRNRVLWVIAAVVVVGAAVIAAILLAGGDSEKKTASKGKEVLTEPISSTGANPFSPPTGTDYNNMPAVKTSGVSTQQGGQVGLYGGTQNQAQCDKTQLVTFLQQHPDKGAAWASTLGIQQSEISTYVDGLTSVLLRSDTRVTNHGFKNGHVTTIQSVLQAGTAVLVDDKGEPVTKCYCGNPLTSPVPYPRVYYGPRWSGYNPNSLTVIIKNTVIIDTFTLVDPRTGQTFPRQQRRHRHADRHTELGTEHHPEHDTEHDTEHDAQHPGRALRRGPGEVQAPERRESVLSVPRTNRGFHVTDGLDRIGQRPRQLRAPCARHDGIGRAGLPMAGRQSDARVHAARRLGQSRKQSLLRPELAPRARKNGLRRPPSRSP